jgi:PAS domain S-box-containing protein
MIAHGFAALGAAWLFYGKVELYLVFGWLLALAFSVRFASRYDLTLLDVDRRRMGRKEINRQTGTAMFTGLAWALPIGLSGLFGDGVLQVEIWAVIASLLIVTALVLPSVPLGTVMLSVIISLAAVLNFVLCGNYYMAVIALVFGSAVSAGAVQSARNYLATRIAEAGLAEKSEVVSLLLREFEEGEADWLWQIDTSRRVRAVSPRFAFALGIDPENIDGKPFIQLIAGAAWETGQFPSSLHDLAERLKRRESFSNMLVRVSIRGTQRWWELSGTPKLDDSGVFDGFRGVGSDVTEQRESSEKIAYMARYDTLTGLPNRMMLNEALADAMRYSEQWRTRCAFLMIDLDRFKSVNDTLGHLVGDQLLARVSERLREQMSDNELCGRLGGTNLPSSFAMRLILNG